jgi:uncharacterized cupin superfamily protein
MPDAEILTAHVDDELEVYEVAPEDLIAGEPRPRSKLLVHDGTDMSQGYSGIFEAEPGAVRSPLAAPETFHVVKGEARLDEASGLSVDLKPGDIVVVPAGDWTFTFASTFRAVFAAGPHDSSSAAADQA